MKVPTNVRKDAFFDFLLRKRLKMQSKGYFGIFLVLAFLLFSAEYTPAAKFNWSGEWRRLESSKYYYATIKITHVTPNSFHFSISARSGANEGEMQSLAKFKGNRATSPDKEKCQVNFRMAGADLGVEASEECQRYAGAGVYFGGTFRKAGEIPMPTLKDYGIFPKEREERAFRHLTGRDYALFVDSMALNFEKADLDGMRAKVFSGTVRGLFGVVGAIVMFRDALNMWAAVIDEEVVKYYTTVPEFRDRLPRTIEKLREGFQEKKVLFMSDPSIPAGSGS